MTIILQNSRQKHCIPQCAVASIRKGKSDVIWDNPQRFNLCSISKFITALLVLKAIQDGHAALNTPVKRILPIFSNPAITLHQLLTHTSGIKDNPYFDGHLRASDERILSISAPFEPGTFNYSDQGYMILQIILEKCYHLGFEEIASASLFEPLHLRSMAYINHPDDLNDKEYIRGTHPDLSLVDQDLTIYPFPAASGLWCTLADFTLFIQALLKGWHNEGSFPIQASFLRQLVESTGLSAIGRGCFKETTPRGLEISSLGWGEGFQSMLAFYPETQDALIIFTNHNSGKHQRDGFCGDVYHDWVKSLKA